MKNNKLLISLLAAISLKNNQIKYYKQNKSVVESSYMSVSCLRNILDLPHSLPNLQDAKIEYNFVNPIQIANIAFQVFIPKDWLNSQTYNMKMHFIPMGIPWLYS